LQHVKSWIRVQLRRSSNLILNDEIVEKTINKKTCRRKGTKKKIELKSDKKTQ
jgi:hypothetical protein